jgi:preprotein translocase subunit SecG
METVVWMLHIVVSISVIGLVLMQHGKGADMGAAFGSGASGSLFGATGSANFLSRTTGVLATMFFLTSMGLTFFALDKSEAVSVMNQAKPAAGQQQGPARSGGDNNPPSRSKADEVPK